MDIPQRPDRQEFAYMLRTARNSLKFSSRELKEIGISVAALSLVFSYPEVILAPLFFFTSLLTVGLAFMGHELSHKFVAKSRGFSAEYRMWPQGLFLALLFALATEGRIIFAAPGAVYFGAHMFRSYTRQDTGVIGISGSAFNLALFLIFMPAYLLTGLSVLRFAALINVWFALFNLIPVPPLDGSKVLAWNPKMWALAFGVSILGFALLIL